MADESKQTQQQSDVPMEGSRDIEDGFVAVEGDNLEGDNQPDIEPSQSNGSASQGSGGSSGMGSFVDADLDIQSAVPLEDSRDIEDGFVAVEGDNQPDVEPSQSNGSASQGSEESSGMGSFVDFGLDIQNGGDASRRSSLNSEPSLVVVENLEANAPSLSANEETVNVDETEIADEQKQTESLQDIDKKDDIEIEENQDNDAATGENVQVDQDQTVLETKKIENEGKEESSSEVLTEVVVEGEKQEAQPEIEKKGKEVQAQVVDEIQTELESEKADLEEKQEDPSASLKSEPESAKIEDQVPDATSNDDSITLERSASSVTSASQVTEVHCNTAGNNKRNFAPRPITIGNSTSDISNDLEKSDSALSSESFLQDKERLRLRKIALQSVAASLSSHKIASQAPSMTTVQEAHDTKNTNDKELSMTRPMATVQEAHNVLGNTPKRMKPFDDVAGGASKSTAQFDPYAFVGKEGAPAASEIEMKSMAVGGTISVPTIVPAPGIVLIESAQTENIVDMTPAPETIINITKSAASNVSNSSAPTQTFEKLEPLMTQDGTFVDIGRLIVVGVAGAVGGVLLSHFALTTCDFVSIEVPVGYYNETLTAHAGMSEFSSLDSVIFGSSFGCISYEDQYYGQEAPEFAKIMSMLAMVFGSIATLIVWLYNFTSSTTVIAWTLARMSATAAALFQFGTLQFFYSQVCEDNACSIGTGSFFSFIAGCIYAYMAFEMGRNSPVQRMIPGMCKELIAKGDTHGDVDSLGKEKDSYYSAPELV